MAPTSAVREGERRLVVVIETAFARTRFQETAMKNRIALALALAVLAGPALARQPKTYQVTGEVLEVSDDLVVVQKGKEKFEIARTPDTKVTGDLVKGRKATVEYRMTAATAEVKGAPNAATSQGTKKK
jgi:hypothetical protein